MGGKLEKALFFNRDRSVQVFACVFSASESVCLLGSGFGTSVSRT